MLTTLDIERILTRYYTNKSAARTKDFPVRGSASGYCPRKLSSLIAKRPSSDATPRGARIFEDGDDRDKALGKAFAAERQLGCEIVLQPELWTTIPNITGLGLQSAIIARATKDFGAEAELPIRATVNGLQIRSHPDVLFLWPDNHVDIIEVKGKNDYGLKRLPEEGSGREYETQLAIMVLALKEKRLTVDSATWLYENKDKQTWLPYSFDFDSAGVVAAPALAEIASILHAYALPKFDGDEGTPIWAELALFEGAKKLPWQCNYCSIGPKTGNCIPGRTLIDKRKTGADIPVWEIV